MICDYCHEDKPDVKWEADPYMSFIYGDIDESYWCDDCFCNREDDI